MPYTNTGSYLPVSGSESAAPGQIIKSATWNAIHTDFATAAQQSLQQQLSFSCPHNIAWMNGGFDVDQRLAGNTGTFNSGSTSYTVDRWYLQNPNNSSMTVQQTAGLFTGSPNAVTIRRTNTNTGTAQVTFGYPFDTDEVQRLRGATVSMSFTGKAGGGMSNSALTMSLWTGTGAVTKFVNGFTNSALIAQVSGNLGATATLFNTVGLVATSTSIAQAEIVFTWTPSGTAGSDDSWSIDGVELDVNGEGGTFIYGFEQLPINKRLAGCQRFYAKTFPYGTQPANSGGFPGSFNAILNTGQSPSFNWLFPVTMRATPAVTTYNPFANNSNIQVSGGGAVYPAALGANLGSTQVLIYSTNTATRAADGPFVHASADASI